MNELEILKSKWQEIKETVKRDHEISDVAYKAWIIPLQIHSINENIIYLLVPTEQSPGVNYISNKYKTLFIVAISEVMNKEYGVEFITEEQHSERESSYNNTEEKNYERANLNPKYTFDTFVVGPNNQLAHSAAVAVAENPGNTFNPLFIYGGPGLGKTHLMHSIGHYIISKNPRMNVKYVTSETFTNQVVESIRSGSQAMSKLREEYRSVDVLLLDDVQFVIGKESTQNEFFNTFNVLHSSNKAIVLSSDKPPKDIETLEERLRSRFEWGLSADINPPDYETRMAILRKYAENFDIFINDDIIEYVAQNIQSNIRELEGALNKIIATKKMNESEGSPFTLEDATNAIKDMISNDATTQLTVQRIIDEVSRYYNIDPSLISSSKRNKEIVIPRQVAMYISRELTTVPLAEIGKIMGNRDHTTVIHGHDKIEEDLPTDPLLKEAVNDITKKLVPNP